MHVHQKPKSWNLGISHTPRLPRLGFLATTMLILYLIGDSATTMQLQCNHNATTMQLQCNYSATTMQLLCWPGNYNATTMQLQCNYNATTMLAWQSLCLCSSVTAVYTAYLWLPIALTHPLSLPFPQPQFPTRPYYFLLPPSQYHMAFDEGWAISARLQEAISLRPQPLEKAGKSHLPIGYYRINLSIIEPDNLYEFETVHFINITGQLNIGHNYLVAQLRHGEIVHVYGTGDSEFLQ